MIQDNIKEDEFEIIKDYLIDIKDFNLCLKKLSSLNLNNFKGVQIIYIMTIELFNKQEYIQSLIFIDIGIYLFKEISKNEYISTKDQYFLQSLYYDYMKCKLEIEIKNINIINFIKTCIEENKLCFEGYKIQQIFNIQFLIFCYYKISNENKIKTFIIKELINCSENKQQLDIFIDLILNNKNIINSLNKIKIKTLNPILWLFISEEIINNQYELILNYFITNNNLEENLQELLSLSIKFSIIYKENYDKLYFKIINGLLEIKTVFGDKEIEIIKKYGTVLFKYKLTDSNKLNKNMEDIFSLLNMDEIIKFIIETQNFNILEKLLKINILSKNKEDWELLFITLVSMKKYKEVTKLLEKEKISITNLIKKDKKDIKYEILFEYFIGIKNIEIIKILINEIKEKEDFLKCFKILLNNNNKDLIIQLIERIINEKDNIICILHCLKYLSINIKNNLELIYKIINKIFPILNYNKFLYNFIYNYTIDIIEYSSNLDKIFLKSALEISLKYLNIGTINIDCIEISLNIYNCLLECNINVYIKDIYNLWELYNIIESKKIEEKRRDQCLLIFFCFFTKEKFINDSFKCLENITKSIENIKQICDIEIFYGCKSIKITYWIFKELIEKEFINKIYLESCLYLFISIGPSALIDFLEFLEINLLKNKKLIFKDLINEQIIY